MRGDAVETRRPFVSSTSGASGSAPDRKLLHGIVQPAFVEFPLGGHLSRDLVDLGLRLEDRIDVLRRPSCGEGKRDRRSTDDVHLALDATFS